MNQRIKVWLPLAVAVVIVAVIAIFLIGRMNSGSNLPVGEPAKPFSLQNLDGETISLDNTAGKARLIYFYFGHCPSVCFPTNHLLSQVQEGLKEKGVFGDKAQIMSITFDPERDTVEFLREYSSGMRADYSGWHFLRDDDVEALRSLAESYIGPITPVEEDGEVIDIYHANIFFLVDGEGRIRKEYSPNRVVVIDQSKTEEFIDEIVRDMVSLTR